MSSRTMMVLLLALVFGGAAAIGVKAFMKSDTGPTTQIVVAVTTIQRGEMIADGAVKLQTTSDQSIPNGAFSRLEDVIGRPAFITLLAGDAIVEEKLAPRGSGVGMSSMIKAGMRAFTITTPTLSASMAGHLLPGNRVDVILTLGPIGPQSGSINFADLSGMSGSGESSSSNATTTLLQNIEVLAVHTTTDAPKTSRIDPKDAGSVTLHVTPDQAAILDLGQNKGTLHLSLRNLKDETDVKAKIVTVNDLKIFDLKNFQEKLKASLPQLPIPKPVETVLPTAPPQPEFEEQIIFVRTLRGTTVGVDQHKMLVPATRATFQPRSQSVEKETPRRAPSAPSKSKKIPNDRTTVGIQNPLQ